MRQWKYTLCQKLNYIHRYWLMRKCLLIPEGYQQLKTMNIWKIISKSFLVQNFHLEFESDYGCQNELAFRPTNKVRAIVIAC